MPCISATALPLNGPTSRNVTTLTTHISDMEPAPDATYDADAQQNACAHSHKNAATSQPAQAPRLPCMGPQSSFMITHIIEENILSNG